jgi:hypothetical protein
MAFRRHFLPDRNFAFTRCYGSIDDNSLRIHILSFNNEAKGMRSIRELADARELDNAGDVTVQGLVQLSELGHERAAGRDGLLAIVVADALIFEMATIYATLVNEIKMDVRVFYDVAEALAWLGYDEQEAIELMSFMRACTP